jgi:hypothetical protein
MLFIDPDGQKNTIYYFVASGENVPYLTEGQKIIMEAKIRQKYIDQGASKDVAVLEVSAADGARMRSAPKSYLDKSDVLLSIVELPESDRTMGQAAPGLQVGDVYWNNNSIGTIVKTFIHEIGHALFGYPAEAGENKQGVPGTYMEAENTGNMDFNQTQKQDVQKTFKKDK